MATPSLHFCLGADCPGLESIPSRANPHPSSCSLAGCEIATCFEDIDKPEPSGTHMLRARQAIRDGDDEALEHHLRLLFEADYRERRIARYTLDLESQQPPEDSP